MKFGKELLHAAAACEPIVDHESWMDYKVLKKMLKQNPMEQTITGANQKERIVKSGAARRFFLALQQELTKVDKRYLEIKAKAVEMARTFLNEPLLLVSSVERQRMCADIHLYLLVVKNFGVLNYCGFKKILKKHDKLRKLTTRDSYMVKVVNTRSFSRFDEFGMWLELLERHYQTLSACASPTLQSVLFGSQHRQYIAHQGSDRLRLLVNVVETNTSSGEEQLFVKRARLCPLMFPPPLPQSHHQQPQQLLPQPLRQAGAREFYM
ncbi:hypothetical protein BASA81_003842 [Batrachochytrium salamandrivorans]|nr:hypothetical protein BASA81_003842 [Batrachochytrium salamandrivorans]